MTWSCPHTTFWEGRKSLNKEPQVPHPPPHPARPEKGCLPGGGVEGWGRGGAALTPEPSLEPAWLLPPSELGPKCCTARHHATAPYWDLLKLPWRCCWGSLLTAQTPPPLYVSIQQSCKSPLVPCKK